MNTPAIDLPQVIKEYSEWVLEHGGKIEVTQDEDDFFISRNGGLEVTVYVSEIDPTFYGQGEALFLEAQVTDQFSAAELKDALGFVAEEVVLSRVNLSKEGNTTAMVVDCGIPFSEISYPLLDLALREVASTCEDIKNRLGLEEDE